MNLPHVRTMLHSAAPLAVVIFLATIVGCVLVVDKNSLENILGKEDVHELKATAGRTEIDLHWRNPSAADVEKIVIWYSPTAHNLNNKIEVHAIQQNKLVTKKIPHLLPNTQYSFKVIVIYPNGKASSGVFTWAKTTH